jgi:glycosyltransferase involved in cell wall biosynthesis
VAIVQDSLEPGATIVLVDWLGRGGIAHTSEAWVRELQAQGRITTLVTRAGRELGQAVPERIVAGGRGGPLLDHAAVVLAAIRAQRQNTKCTVILQGSIMPQLELGVAAAARASGNRVILVAHESAITRRSPGSKRAFARLVRSVDTVIAHTRFVAADVTRLTGRTDIELVPLPLAVGLLDLVGSAQSVLNAGSEPVALQFGHLHRDYKGLATVLEIASRGAPGWRVALVGKGAPATAVGAVTVPRFLDAAELVGTVAGSAVSLLPYERASQSGAVTLAQALGSVVIASGVGGIPEQIEHGVTGLLIAPKAPVEAWLDALASLSDQSERGRIAGQASSSVKLLHQVFVRRIAEVLD